MNQMTASPAANPAQRSKVLLPSVLLVGLILAGFFAFRILSTRQAVLSNVSTAAITQGALEQQYGVHVNLIGVTAAGGLVDVRLKVLDAAKAGQLLQGKPPTLLVRDSGIVLPAPEDSQSQVTDLKDGGSIFLLFPNAQNAVKPGSPVAIVFGEVQVEPIPAR